MLEHIFYNEKECRQLFKKHLKFRNNRRVAIQLEKKKILNELEKYKKFQMVNYMFYLKVFLNSNDKFHPDVIFKLKIISINIKL